MTIILCAKITLKNLVFIYIKSQIAWFLHMHNNSRYIQHSRKKKHENNQEYRRMYTRTNTRITKTTRKIFKYEYVIK